MRDLLLSKAYYGKIERRMLQLKVYEIHINKDLKYRILKSFQVTPHGGILQHISVQYETLTKFKIFVYSLHFDVCRSPEITET